jgi:N-acetylneuraminate synthase/N,N'-diacetyllegionaminate synthase
MRGEVLIIAEAGVNHDGDMSKAAHLIEAAANAGADFVKFQSFRAEKLVSPDAKKAEYQERNIGDQDDKQFAMLKKLELTNDQHLFLMDECKKHGIEFLSTAFDVEGLDYLNRLGLNFFKVPSGEITNYPYLKKLASFGKPVILSTGMANMNEIKSALEVLEIGVSREKITVLHCNTEYPTPMQDVNLLAMNAIARECKVQVGYSDHTLGIEVPIAAVALGATVIEKHFTLDRNLPGPDHKASLEPEELKAMVRGIRNIELAISGSGRKEPSKSETKNKPIARKSIHLKQALGAGHRLKEEDLIPLRPGDGISPMKWNEVVGKKLSQNCETFHKLQESDLV